MRLLVTGASGFIGQSVCRELVARGHTVHGVIRSLDSVSPASLVGLDYSAIGDIGAGIDWSAVLDSRIRGDRVKSENREGIDCIIHCAARAHVIHETESDALAAYRAVNVDGTRRLAEQAANAGVRRFVFLSSIGVLGIHTNGRGPFFVYEAPSPVEDYAISKWEAEKALHAVAACTGLEVVIVRPPLVYGPGAKGNFTRLLELVSRGLPLPLAAVDNRRSLVGLDNLVDLLIRCAEHPRVAGQTFLVSDGLDLSTSELLHRIAAVMGRPRRLFPVPVPLLRAAGRIFGRLNEIDRLVGSLQVDASHTRNVLDWTPPVSVEEGFRKTAEWYMNRR